MTNKPIKYLPSEEIIHVGDFNFDAYCGASELNSLSNQSKLFTFFKVS